MEYKVSVIVPAYNVECYLEKCIDSLLAQSLQEIEIICINDGSTDHTREIIEGKAEKDARITVIHQENQGLSAVRNRGIELARGKYVVFLDSDDWLEENALFNLYSVAESDNLDAYFFAAQTEFETEKLKESNSRYITAYSRGDMQEKALTGREMLMHQISHGEYSASACLYLLKRDFLNRYHIRFERGILHEDNLFTFTMLLYAERTGSTSARYYHRLLREASIMTAGPTWKNVQGYVRLVRKEIGMLTESDMSLADEEGYMILCESLFYDCVHIWCELSGEEREKAYQNMEKEDCIFLKTTVVPSCRKIQEYKTMLRDDEKRISQIENAQHEKDGSEKAQQRLSDSGRIERLFKRPCRRMNTLMKKIFH